MRQPLVIVWRVYEPCNLACPFCEYSRDIVRKRSIVSRDVILRFGSILSQYKQATGQDVLVSWLGGEPLLWKELPSISEIYHREFDIRLGVTTNGTSLDRDHIRATLIGHYSSVTISVDGFSDFHNFHRGEAGLFEKIKCSIGSMTKEISAANSPLKLRINTILMRSNLEDFESFCMEVADWGVEELTFNQLGGYERTEFYKTNRLLPEQALWLRDELPRIQQKAAARGLNIFGGTKYLDRILATSRDIAIPIDDCQPGTQFLFVNEANLASPCHFTTESYGIPIAEIETLSDMMKLSEIFRRKQQAVRALPCSDCHSTQVFEKFN